MSKYFLYTRKSSEAEDRQILSIDSQIKELRELAKKLDIEIKDVLSESKSAKLIGRPVFNNMIERLERGEVDSILVWHPDRLSRNPEDSAKIIALMDSGKLIQVNTPSQTFRNNPMDKFMLGFFMMNAKLENDNKSVNVKRGLKIKAEKGWLPSGAKPGYMNDKYAEKGNKTVKNDPIRFSLIRKAWDMMLTGLYSPPYILDKLNNEWGYRTPKHKRIGGKPMSRSTIYKVFSDPFYYGEFEYPEKSGNWYKGTHEAMITKEEFDKVQVLLGRKGKMKLTKHTFDFINLMTCGECGASITAEEKRQIICSACKTKFHRGKNTDKCNNCQTLIEEMKDPTILHYIYYHCTKRKNPNCTQGGIQVKELEKQVDKILSKVQISERFKGWAIKYLNELNDKEVEGRNAVLGSLQGAYNDAIQRIDNLVKLKISPQNTDGSILSDEEFKHQKEILLREKESLNEKLGDTDGRINRWLELSEKTFEFACYARYWFANGDFKTKREIFQGLGQNLILKDKILLPDLEKPLQFIEEMRKAEPLIVELLEPEEKIDNSIQLEALWSKNPSLLPLPRITIIADEVKLDTVIQGFQNLSYIGEMRQRWEEIKKLSRQPSQPSLVA